MHLKVARLRSGGRLHIQDGFDESAPPAPAGRVDLWLPLAYVMTAGAWIAFSDLIVGSQATSAEMLTTISILKGLGFVLVTGFLLHVALAWARRRERRAYRQLERSEALFRHVTDSLAEPIFLKDLTSRWVFANPAALRVIGRPANEVVGRTDAELYADPEVARALMATDRRIIETGVAEVLEETIQTPQGYRVFLTSKAPYRDAAGEIVGIIGNAQDITERKRSETSLREQVALKDQIEKLAASVPGLICSFRVERDGKASMPFTTPAIEELYGLSSEDVARDVGAWAANLHPDEAQRVADTIAAAVRSTAPWHDVFRYRHPKKGWRWIEGWSVPRLEPDGATVFHGFLMDVTDVKRLQQQLQDALRLESVGRLAGGVAHDFNNLLTVILGCAEVLKSAVAAGDRVDPELVSDITSAAESARGVTRQLLAFARRQIIDAAPLDLNRLVMDAEKLLRRVLGEHVEVAVRLGPELWTVRGDVGQIEQVILNLAVNARDAMPDGGTLSIETANVEIDDATAAARPSMRSGSFVRLTIRDSGRGMPLDVKEHAFEPFYTTKPTGRGTGLGLATVYGIVTQSDGFVLLDSEPGKGATFEIYLPRLAEAEAQQPQAAPRATPVPLAPAGTREETVLVVEDDPQVREITVRSLRRAGFQVLVAQSGREALDLDAKQLSDARVLVTDVVMPGMGGRALANELCSRHPRMRVLYVSGYNDDAFVGAGVDFLPKPFTPNALVSRVQTILAR